MSWNVSQCNSHRTGRWEIYLGEKTREKFRHAWPKHEPWSWLAREHLRSSAQTLFTPHRKSIALIIVDEDHSLWFLVRNRHPSVKLKQQHQNCILCVALTVCRCQPAIAACNFVKLSEKCVVIIHRSCSSAQLYRHGLIVTGECEQTRTNVMSACESC